MQDGLAYWNGRVVDAADVRLGLGAAAMVYGASITERLRTFGGRLFRLEEHMRRLRRSLAVLGLAADVLPDGLEAAAQALVDEALRREGAAEMGLVILVWPPAPEAIGCGEELAERPDVVMHTHRLELARWAPLYAEGVRLTISSVRQVPAACWPRWLKCRSRMHYYLAIREAQRREPGGVPVLLDPEGHITETPTANLVLLNGDGRLVAPPGDEVLPGVSLGMLRELAAELGFAWREQPLIADDVYAADEVMLTSTPFCVLPAVGVDEHTIGSGSPGPVYRQLLDAWSRRVGVDIAAQAARGV